MVSRKSAGFSGRRNMLKRWLPPQDEGASMLRLLNLLSWPNAELPALLCGPLYDACARFDASNADHSLNINMPIIYKFPVLNADSVLIRVVVWRVNVLSHLANQAGILSQYFPSDDRRCVASKIFAMLDSMFPLIDYLEANPTLLINDVYLKHLEPEGQRSHVIDYSCTYFISYMMPYALSATSVVSPLLLEILNCKQDDPDFKSLVEIVRCLTIKRERMRHLLNVVFSALRGVGSCNWLSNIIITVIKYALLGNYPSSEQYADFPVRRKIYHLSREKILDFFFMCGNENDAMLGMVQALLSVMLLGTFSTKSFDYIPLDHILIEQEVFQYFRVMKRILKLVTNFYPAPTKNNLISDVYRFLTPIHLKYQNIFYALHASRQSNTKMLKSRYSYLNGCNIIPTQLKHLYVLIILNEVDEKIIETILAMQTYFDKTGTLWRPPNLPGRVFDKIMELSAVVVGMHTFHVTQGSQALYFEQASRLLKIVGSLAPEKTSVLYCNNCNTVRFRPVGVHLPSSHITLLADLANNRVHCVDCSSDNLSQVNVLGKYVRCFLSNKKNKSIVTLALCSACMHISVCGFYSYRHGSICKECELAVRNTQQLSKACLACHSIMTKLAADDPVWPTIDVSNTLKMRYWCKRCTPNDFKTLRTNNWRVPLFSEATLLHHSSKLPARRYF